MNDLTSYEVKKYGRSPANSAAIAARDLASRVGNSELVNHCQNCGDTKRNHKPGGACRGRLMAGKRFTAWTQETMRAAITEGRKLTGNPECPTTVLGVTVG